MFELGTTKHWWDVAKKYPRFSNHSFTLKPLGYAHMVNLIETHGVSKILEVGHGSGSFLFDIFKDKCEMWGLDDIVEDSRVETDKLLKLREENPHVKFKSGLLGQNIKELPDNYFDMVCSVSVIEHIPVDSLKAAFEETYRILKPGGIVSHSYDIYYRQNTKNVFDAYENTGFEWLKPRDSMNVFWEDWLVKPDLELMKDIFGKIMFENPMFVAEVYMWQKARDIRPTPLNWMTVLTAAKKPL